MQQNDRLAGGYRLEQLGASSTGAIDPDQARTLGYARAAAAIAALGFAAMSVATGVFVLQRTDSDLRVVGVGLISMTVMPASVVWIAVGETVILLALLPRHLCRNGH